MTLFLRLNITVSLLLKAKTRLFAAKFGFKRQTQIHNPQIDPQKHTEQHCVPLYLSEKRFGPTLLHYKLHSYRKN